MEFDSPKHVDTTLGCLQSSVLQVELQCTGEMRKIAYGDVLDVLLLWTPIFV